VVVRRRNLQQCENLRAYLQADATILKHYMDEVRERDLYWQLPRLTAATTRASLANDECKQLILTALATGPVQ
jgi:hypothetical protein